MRTVLLLALCPSILAAQDATRHTWGSPVEGSTPSMVVVGPCNSPCVAIVRFDNTLVTSGTTADMASHPPLNATLALDGIVLAVTVEHGGGMAPDLLRVRPPWGYAVEPGEVLVEDNASGSLRVVLVPTS